MGLNTQLGLGIGFNVFGNAGKKFKNLNGGYSKFRRNVKSGTGAMTSSFGKMGSSILKFIGIAGGLMALGGLFKSATTQALKFGSAMGEVSTLLDDEFMGLIPKLTKDVKRLSAEFGQDKVNSAKAFYQAISAGVDPRKATEFMGIAGRMAVGGITDMETAVDGLTNIKNAFGLAMGDMTALSDQMFTTMKLGKTTITELASSLGQVSPIAKNVGLSTSEMLTSVGAITKVGLSTAEAVTGLKAVLTAVAKGTPESVKMAEKYGITMSTAAIKAQGFAGWLAKLKKVADKHPEAMSKIFRRVQAMNAVFALTSKQGFSDFNNMLGKIRNSAGATETAFIKISETPEFKLKRLRETWKNTMITLGNALLKVIMPMIPIFTKVSKGIERFIIALQNLSPTQMMLVKSALIAIGIVIGAMIIPALLSWVALQLLLIATNPITWIIVGLTAVVFGIMQVVKHWDKIVKFFKKTISNIRVFFKALGKTFMGLLDKTPDWLLAITFFPLLLIKRMGAVKESFKVIFDWFGKQWGDMMASGSLVFQDLKNLVVGLWTTVEKLFIDIWNNVVKLVNKLSIFKAFKKNLAEAKVEEQKNIQKDAMKALHKSQVEAQKKALEDSRKKQLEEEEKRKKAKKPLMINTQILIGNKKVYDAQEEHLSEQQLRNFVFVR